MKYLEVAGKRSKGAAGGQGDGGKYNIDLLHRVRKRRAQKACMISLSLSFLSLSLSLGKVGSEMYSRSVWRLFLCTPPFSAFKSCMHTHNETSQVKVPDLGYKKVVDLRENNNLCDFFGGFPHGNHFITGVREIIVY